MVLKRASIIVLVLTIFLTIPFSFAQDGGCPSGEGYEDYVYADYDDWLSNGYGDSCLQGDPYFQVLNEDHFAWECFDSDPSFNPSAISYGQCQVFFGVSPHDDSRNFFFSSSVHTGSIPNPDQICADDATARGLSGTYKAAFSGSDLEPETRYTYPFAFDVRPAGQVIFQTDEQGNAESSFVTYFDIAFTFWGDILLQSPQEDCSDWTSDFSNDMGSVTRNDAGGEYFSPGSTDYCLTSNSLLCVEVPLDSNFIVTPETFISTWDTTLVSSGSSASTQITLPLIQPGSYNFVVDWGDGKSDIIKQWNQPEVTHTYDDPGEYEIKITGEIRGFQFANTGDRLKLTDISQWGDLQFTNLGYQFEGARNLDVSATDAPDLSSITSMEGMFVEADAFNANINHWDVSSIINMERLFSYADIFNQPLNNWDVSNVQNMERVFYRAESFNQDISSWDVSSATSMHYMFGGALAFNHDISDWDVSNVRFMSGVFAYADSFNQPLSNWDVSSATTMASMFFGATNFNQDISSWDVSNVINMDSMFFGATNFNQDISSWDVSTVNDMDRMFSIAERFNQDLSCWDVSSDPSNYDFANYAILWTLPKPNFGGSPAASCSGGYGPDAFVTEWDTAQTSFGSSANNQIKLPLESTGTYNFVVDWGDGTTDTITSWDQPDVTHTYDDPGIYIITITGELNGWKLGDFRDGYRQDNFKILEVMQWGSMKLGNSGGYFQRAENLQLTATDAPDLSGTTDLSYMFSSAYNLNADFSNWDVSGVTNMDYMFGVHPEELHNDYPFNGDVSSWDVSSVTSMRGMFAGAENFNQNLECWDVSSVTSYTDFDTDTTAWTLPKPNFGGEPPASCSGEVLGCTDPTNVNFDPLATQDDGSCAICGDNVLNQGESCDFGSGRNNGIIKSSLENGSYQEVIAPLYGQMVAVTTCSSTCQMSIEDFIGPHCGDGYKNGEEMCDFGEFNTDVMSPSKRSNTEESFDEFTQPSYGQSATAYYCSLACTSSSQEVTGTSCGDGIVQAGEVCDFGAGKNNGVHWSTNSQEYFTRTLTYGGGSLTTYSCSACAESNTRIIDEPYCGDGFVDLSYEQCDSTSGCQDDCTYGGLTCTLDSTECFVDGEWQSCAAASYGKTLEGIRIKANIPDVSNSQIDISFVNAAKAELVSEFSFVESDRLENGYFENTDIEIQIDSGTYEIRSQCSFGDACEQVAPTSPFNWVSPFASYFRYDDTYAVNRICCSFAQEPETIELVTQERVVEEPTGNYEWVTSDWRECDVLCGSGEQTRTVICTQDRLIRVEDSLCTEPKPETSQPCNAGVCEEYSWVTGGWSQCSATCGGGIQTQTVYCADSNGNRVSDSRCGIDSKPSSQQVCNDNPCFTYDWLKGQPGECSATCGGGTARRIVYCRQTNVDTGISSVAPENKIVECGTPIPSSLVSCNTQAC